jgi:hypothetical protein
MKKQLFEFLGSADVQQFFEHSVIRPLLDKIFQYLYPYLLGVVVLWGIMLVCIVMVLILVLRAGLSVQMGVK